MPDRVRNRGSRQDKRRADAKKPATLARYRLSAKGVGKHLHEFDHMSGRGERIRTSDSCVPNAVLYQAELRPESYYYY